jgi:hypothetical protein
MRRRPETPRRNWRSVDALQPTVEREIEIVSRLLSVGDHIKPGGNLIVDCRDDRVRPHFLNVSLAELIEVCRGKLQPPWKRVTPDHRSP